MTLLVALAVANCHWFPTLQDKPKETAAQLAERYKSSHRRYCGALLTIKARPGKDDGQTQEVIPSITWTAHAPSATAWGADHTRVENVSPRPPRASAESLRSAWIASQTADRPRASAAAAAAFSQKPPREDERRRRAIL